MGILDDNFIESTIEKAWYLLRDEIENWLIRNSTQAHDSMPFAGYAKGADGIYREKSCEYTPMILPIYRNRGVIGSESPQYKRVLISPLVIDDKKKAVRVVSPKYPIVIKEGVMPPEGMKFIANKKSTIHIICFNLHIPWEKLQEMCPQNDIQVQRYLLLE